MQRQKFYTLYSIHIINLFAAYSCSQRVLYFVGTSTSFNYMLYVLNLERTYLSAQIGQAHYFEKLNKKIEQYLSSSVHELKHTVEKCVVHLDCGWLSEEKVTDSFNDFYCCHCQPNS